MNNNPVSSLLLYDRFIDTEFIYPFGQRRNVLLDAVFPDLFDGIRAQCNDQLVASGFFPQCNLGKLVGKNPFSTLACLRIVELQFDCITGTHEPGITDIVFTQQISCRNLQSLYSGVDRRIDINLHEEMNASAKVKAKVHG